MTWPPRPGEIWVADDEWPRTVHRPNEPSVDINAGDIFLVVGAGRVVEEELNPGKLRLQDFKSYKSVSLEVVVHGIKRMMVSECIDGKLDMHPLEQPTDSCKIIIEET